MSTKAIVPVKLSLTEGDFYTLWAPAWREHGAQWQAFLGADDELYFFRSPGQLLAFLESGQPHDLTEHPKWETFAAADESRVAPQERHTYDIIGAPALLAQRPSHVNVKQLSGIFAFTRSLAQVSGAEAVEVFFASHSILHNVDRGFEHYAGEHGLSEWSGVGRVVLENWKRVVEALDAKVTLVDVDEAVGGDADTRVATAVANAAAAKEKERAARKEELDNADPYDTTVWATSGIDPIKIVIDGSTLYTLRTYVDDVPVFLGRYGEMFTFNSRKALVRWIIGNDEHNLANLSTWESLVAAANDGQLDVTVHPDNVYAFNGLRRDIAKGVDAVDTKQLGRCYELLADAADWAADDSLNSYFLAHPRMQDYIAYMLGSTETSGYVPSAPFTQHSEGWAELEKMLVKRFSRS